MLPNAIIPNGLVLLGPPPSMSNGECLVRSGNSLIGGGIPLINAGNLTWNSNVLTVNGQVQVLANGNTVASIVKAGTTSPTVAIQQWQAYNGTVLGSFKQTTSVYGTNNAVFILGAEGMNGANNCLRIEGDGSTHGWIHLSGNNANDYGPTGLDYNTGQLRIYGYSSVPVKIGSMNINRSSFTSYAQFGSSNISLNLGTILNIPSSATVGLTIKGAASQSGNLTEWQNNSGTVLSKIWYDGSISVPYAYIGNYINSQSYRQMSYNDGFILHDSNGAIITTQNTSYPGGTRYSPYFWGYDDIELIHGAGGNTTRSICIGKAFSATPTTGRLSATSGMGTNIAGASLEVNGGQSSGSASGGSVKIRVSPAGSSGTTTNSLVDALVIDSTKKATFSGNIAANSGSLDSPGISFSDGGSSGLWFVDINTLAFVTNGNRAFDIYGSNLRAFGNVITGSLFAFTSGAPNATLPDTAIGRNAGGVVEINNGTPGTYRDLLLRNLTASGNATINIGSSSTVGLTIKSAASQSANLQEWQNSSGTSLVSVSAAGNINTLAGVHQFGWIQIHGANGYINVEPNSYFGWGGNGVGGSIRRIGGVIETWQNGGFASKNLAGNALAPISGSVITVSSSIVNIGSSSVVGLTIKGAASQSANLTEWQNSSGTVGARITNTLEFSNSSNTASEQFGAGAYTGGTASIAFGKNATTAIGSSSSIAIGYQSITNGSLCISIGELATSNTNSIAIGWGANSNVTNGTSLGVQSSCGGFNNTIALGRASTCTQANQCVIGSSTTNITQFCVGSGVTNSTPTNITYIGTGGSGLNIVGGNFIIAPGQSTGNATPASLILQRTTAGSSGTTAQTLSNALVIDGANTSITGGIKLSSLTTNGFLKTSNADGTLTVASSITFAELSSKPTTLSGYGITDGQATLVSGSNIKTINGTSLLGSGDISISGGGSPGGSDTQIQFNNSGSFGGSQNLVWNNLTKTLRLVSTSSYGNHRYWRINVTLNNGSASNWGLTELIFRSVPGGSQIATGGTASASTTLTGYPASNAFDGNVSNLYVATQSTGWLSYDFGTAVSIAEIGIISRFDGFQTDSPRDFQIQYSDNNSSWTTAWTVTNQTSWTNAESRTFTSPDNGSPVIETPVLRNISSTGTNAVASNLNIYPGISTGNATPAKIILQSTKSGSSGSTSQSLIDTLTVEDGIVTIRGYANPYVGSMPYMRFGYGPSSTNFGLVSDGSGALSFGSATNRHVLNVWYSGTNVDRITIGSMGSDSNLGRLAVFATGISGNSNGLLIANGYTATSFTIKDDGATSIFAQQATTIGLTIKGATSQTANLTEWQNSGSTILSRVQSDGSFIAPNYKSSDGSGTNGAASNLNILVGRSTGNATPASIKLQRTTVGSSGSTLQTLSDALVIDGTTTTITGLFSVGKGNNFWAFHEGASSVTPSLKVGGSTVKAGGIQVGSGGVAVFFDDTGVFAIQTETRSAINGNTNGGGTSRLTINGSGTVTIPGNLTVQGSTIILSGLPTSDPGVAGQLYISGGILMVSSGGGGGLDP